MQIIDAHDCEKIKENFKKIDVKHFSLMEDVFEEGGRQITLIKGDIHITLDEKPQTIVTGESSFDPDFGIYYIINEYITINKRSYKLETPIFMDIWSDKKEELHAKKNDSLLCQKNVDLKTILSL